jgi:hypothetical protein
VLPRRAATVPGIVAWSSKASEVLHVRRMPQQQQEARVDPLVAFIFVLLVLLFVLCLSSVYVCFFGAKLYHHPSHHPSMRLFVCVVVVITVIRLGRGGGGRRGGGDARARTGSGSIELTLLGRCWTTFPIPRERVPLRPPCLPTDRCRT